MVPPPGPHPSNKSPRASGPPSPANGGPQQFNVCSISVGGSIQSGSSAGPSSSASGGNGSSSQKTSKEIFKVIAESRICVVWKFGTEHNTQIMSIVEAACKNGGFEPTYLNVNQQCAGEMLDCVQRPGLPLVFVNGDCIGGLAELRALNQSGFLTEALKPHDYDLIVLGGGSGGLAAAKEAAKLGKKVACFDYVKPTPIGTTWGLGGTCVNVGCIPKKLMHQASLLGEAITDAKRFGWQLPENAEPKTHNWAKMKDAIQDHIAGLNWGYRVQLREKQVTYFNSYASFSGTHEITATDKKGQQKKYTANKFLVAVGVRPKYPNVPGDREFSITSDDLFSLPYNPGKTLCIGASYVSLECAGFLKGIGNDVTVMVRSILLRGFDQDMAERIRKQMIGKGINFIAGIPLKFERVEAPTNKEPGLVRVTGQRAKENEDGTRGEMEEFTEEYNTVLIAIGREAQSEDLGLNSLGVKLSSSGKLVGRREQSVSIPHIYAIGDVLEGCPELTPVAIQAGRVLVRRLYTGNMELTEYDEVPTTVFTPLEYGCCGLTEEAALSKYGEENVVVYHNVFIPLEFTLPERKDIEHCYAKLICLKTEQERVLGFHILTPNAGEITQGFAIALKLNAKKADFDRLIGIHPTVAEVFTSLTMVKGKDGELQTQTHFPTSCKRPAISLGQFEQNDLYFCQALRYCDETCLDSFVVQKWKGMNGVKAHAEARVQPSIESRLKNYGFRFDLFNFPSFEQSKISLGRFFNSESSESQNSVNLGDILATTPTDPFLMGLQPFDNTGDDSEIGRVLRDDSNSTGSVGSTGSTVGTELSSTASTGLINGSTDGVSTSSASVTTAVSISAVLASTTDASILSSSSAAEMISSTILSSASDTSTGSYYSSSPDPSNSSNQSSTSGVESSTAFVASNNSESSTLSPSTSVIGSSTTTLASSTTYSSTFSSSTGDSTTGSSPTDSSNISTILDSINTSLSSIFEPNSSTASSSTVSSSTLEPSTSTASTTVNSTTTEMTLSSSTPSSTTLEGTSMSPSTEGSNTTSDLIMLCKQTKMEDVSACQSQYCPGGEVALPDNESRLDYIMKHCGTACQLCQESGPTKPECKDRLRNCAQLKAMPRNFCTDAFYTVDYRTVACGLAPPRSSEFCAVRDVLIHTGDFTNYGDPKAVQEFNELMGSLPHKYKIVIAGNHELGWDETEDLSKRNEYYAGKPGSPHGHKLLTNCIYLQDNSTTVYGINIYGSSWHPLIENPFYRERGASILKEWLKIPTGGEVDVLLTHTPPLGHSDAWYGERWGCAELLNCVEKRVHPKFHVFGHVHEQNGITTNDETTFINASICGHNLDIVNDPILFDIPLPEGQTK
ncbi:pyridine nucleotide-disulfide oxidoreductase domain-containing protein [Ditylenchus destructor]|nr:pyridine nucleotide-disulfide oxidoreductase domain-containing protein [Ditylenchus destructor]